MKNSPETLAKRNRLKREWFQKLKDTNFPREILRICKDCGEEKMCGWNSSFTQTGIPEYRARCKDCFSKYNSKTRKKARSVLTSQKRKRSRVNKQKCVNYLGGKCSVCGYNKSLFALTFHHKDKSLKSSDVSIMLTNMSFNNKKLIDELDKCELLCFNCHMEIHGEERDAEYN